MTEILGKDCIQNTSTELYYCSCKGPGVFDDYSDGMIVEYFCDCDVGRKMFQEYLNENPKEGN